jgi:guanylate kinase
MSADATGRLVILSGPSGVGKSPLERALGKLYPELHQQLRKLLLYNSRTARPGEVDGVDYHFRPRSHVEGLKENTRYAVLDVRGDLQALDLEELQTLLGRGDALFEGNPFVGRLLQTHLRLGDVKRMSVFLSPLSKEEIIDLKRPERNISFHDLLTDIMRRKLLRRTRRQKGELSARDLENIEGRACSAYRELKEAWHFDYVIPNHDGEDSENWDAFYYPVGDARKALLMFASLLEGVVLPSIEIWEESLVL